MTTSYFARLKEISYPVSICGRAPEWYKGPQYKKLAPKLWFFQLYKSGDLDAKGYTEAYKEEVLAPLDPKEVYEKLCSFYNTSEVTLLCYEKPGDFCHRHLIADWLNAAGYDVQEMI